MDRIAAGLLSIHRGEIVCRAGCTDCCRNLSVWPVEFCAILDELRAESTAKLIFDGSASCGFLKDGFCQIYPVRPLICRTHGLPAAFEDDSAAEPEMAVSFCPKNFAGRDRQTLTFGPDNTLNLDWLNEQLSRIHTMFLEELAQENLPAHCRVELRELIDFL